jgi:hypothetical protein
MTPSNSCELLGETERDGAWEYDARIVDGEGSERQIRLRLSWAEYHLWAPAGDVAPARIADAVLRFIAAHAASFAGLERIDAASLRRRVDGADAAIARLLRSG